jgi:hypothetical protein
MSNNFRYVQFFVFFVIITGLCSWIYNDLISQSFGSKYFILCSEYCDMSNEHRSSTVMVLKMFFFGIKSWIESERKKNTFSKSAPINGCQIRIIWISQTCCRQPNLNKSSQNRKVWMLLRKILGTQNELMQRNGKRKDYHSRLYTCCSCVTTLLLLVKTTNWRSCYWAIGGRFYNLIFGSQMTESLLQSNIVGTAVARIWYI